MKKHGLSCPSATNSSGASLFGIVNAEGRISFLPSTVELTPELIELAAEKDRPEAHFRYTSPCAESGCRQWTGSACSVIQRLREAELPDSLQAPQHCPIRTTCRWFAQEGKKACEICPVFTADNLEE